MKPLLIEIGSEEIPARFIARGLASLKNDIKNLLENSLIDYGNISEFSTPRRLAVYIDDVSERQKDRTVESLGPPKKIAFDDKGLPTKAALGFAKSLNINAKNLTVKKTDRGEYVAAVVEEKGQSTKDVLAASLPKLLSSLQLPKTMRWGNGNLRYFRPIQWILTLFGRDPVLFELDGIKSNNISFGHRFLSPGAVRIKDPADYLPLLLNNKVVADAEERKRIISDEIRKIEASADCIVHEDDELLDTVTSLVEYPTVISGTFESRYLDLPKELLITVMRTHQKYFSTEDKNGNILPIFIVVSNTKAENSEMVRKGAERVLRARLEDARFYYEEDQEVPLWDYVDRLRKVTFQEKLGSLYEKSERISSLCSFIADKLNVKKEKQLTRASMLAKADLVTGVVGEFPELQGYMGMTYALNSGEDRETAAAIYEHYRPRYSSDSLPSGELGTVLSLADKIDNIASFFSLGLIPTGSEDPFALRRQTAGIIHMLQSNDYPLSLDILIDRSLQNIAVPSQERKSLLGTILQFFHQRLEGILLTNGYSHDVINAVISTKDANISDICNRVQILSEMKKNPEFPELLTAAKRVYNILSNVTPGNVKENLFAETSEKELFRIAGKIKDALMPENFTALFELTSPINTFFDSVLVMDEDTAIKNNRLALLSTVKRVFDSLGDFSKIAEQS